MGAELPERDTRSPEASTWKVPLIAMSEFVMQLHQRRTLYLVPLLRGTEVLSMWLGVKMEQSLHVS